MHSLTPRQFRSTLFGRGFTLVEMAIVLCILAFLSAGAIVALRTQSMYTRINESRAQLRDARDALLNFAIANQHLPCSASDDNGTANACASAKGFLPWRDLGLPQKDPWGQTLHYAVTTGLTSPGFGFATLGSLQIYSGKATIDNANAVAFVVWSTGEDAEDASAASDGVVTETAGSDDIVEWTSRYLLFGKMTAAGRTLPLAASAASSSASSSSSSPPFSPPDNTSAGG